MYEPNLDGARSRGFRGDAQDYYFLSNQLQSFDQTKYYHLIPGLVGRKVLPPMGGISDAAAVAKWRMTKVQGKARKGLAHGRGGPTVSITQTEETQAIKTFEATMQYTVDELRAARMANESLPEDTRRAAVAAIESAIDLCLATGDTLSSITGLENHASVTGQAAAAAWSGATADQMLSDVSSLISNTMNGLKMAQVPGAPDLPAFNQFVLFLPEDRMIKLATTRLGSTNDLTVLSFIKREFYMLKAIVPWWRLTKGVLAPALDDGSMNPMAGEAILPMDFEALPEQYNGRNISVPCAGKCGGFAWRYTVAARYLTGL
jgi:hypothetical protein